MTSLHSGKAHRTGNTFDYFQHPASILETPRVIAQACTSQAHTSRAWLFASMAANK